MSNKPPTFTEDNPEWTAKDFARAKPASEVHGREIAAAMVRKRGRPAGSTSSTKQQIALRIDNDVVEAFKERGPGWQTRMNEALRTRIDVTYSAALKGWLVTVNRPMDGVAGRAHEIVGKYKSLEEARSWADDIAAGDPGNPRVVVWSATGLAVPA